MQLRVGGLYALYTLYYTQPSQPRMAIPISIGTIVRFIFNDASWSPLTGLWKEIVLLQQQAIHIGNKEAYAIIRRLKQDNAFLFSASVPIIPPPGIVTETTSYVLLIKYDIYIVMFQTSPNDLYCRNVITLRPDILHANTTVRFESYFGGLL